MKRPTQRSAPEPGARQKTNLRYTPCHQRKQRARQAHHSRDAARSRTRVDNCLCVRCLKREDAARAEGGLAIALMSAGRTEAATSAVCKVCVAAFAIQPERATEQGGTEGIVCEGEGAARVRLRLSQHESSGRNKRIVRLRAVPHAMRELDEKAPRATLRPPGRKIFRLRIADCGFRKHQLAFQSAIRIPQLF